MKLALVVNKQKNLLLQVGFVPLHRHADEEYAGADVGGVGAPHAALHARRPRLVVDGDDAV